MPAIALCVTAVLNAQHSTGVPFVNADRPTIVAFFPNAPKIGSDDTDENEALSNFKYYAERAKNPLNELGIQFTVLSDRSFRVRSNNKTFLFAPKDNVPGYYFVAHGKKPRIEYGVMTDTDLVDLAKQYFDFADKNK